MRRRRGGGAETWTISGTRALPFPPPLFLGSEEESVQDVTAVTFFFFFPNPPFPSQLKASKKGILAFLKLFSLTSAAKSPQIGHFVSFFAAFCWAAQNHDIKVGARGAAKGAEEKEEEESVQDGTSSVTFYRGFFFPIPPLVCYQFIWFFSAANWSL